MAAPANNHQAAPASGTLVLPVPYFCQRDSASGEGLRMCFSSTCAMAAAYLRPDPGGLVAPRPGG